MKLDSSWRGGARPRRSNAPRGARSCTCSALVLLGAAALAGCTLQNNTKDFPGGSAPANMFSLQPSERSLELWQNPGDDLLAALSEIEANDKTTVLPQYNRVLGEVLAEAGQYFAALTAFQPFGTAFQAQNMNCTQANLPDAVDTLCATLSDDPNDPKDQDRERLVFINQLQNAPAQVVLMRKLLGCAKDLGFKYLAIEDLEEDAAALTARGYVSRSQSGPYTREPQLARLIQDGLAQGYQIVNYDVSDHCLTCTYEQDISAHAEQQATQLVARTLGIDPDAKVLVLSGPRQSYKEAWGPMNQPATTSLANYVWTQSGLEPYAVDQVEIDRPAGVPFGMSALSTPSGMYMASGPDPMNARCEGAYAPRTENNRGALDAVIVHVPPQNDQSRWEWLHAPEDERRSLTLSCSSCTSGQRLLLQAFPAEVDIADRIPTDQTLCAAGDTCQVVLPSGAYQVVVWSDSEQLGSAAVDLSASSSANVSL